MAENTIWGLDKLMVASGSEAPKMESLLTCPICLDLFTKPVVILPCQHCLCRQCAEDCFDKRGTRFGISGGRFKCPTCRYEVILDRHGIFGLQRNLLVENIIDMMESEKKNIDNDRIKKLQQQQEDEQKAQLDSIKKDMDKQSKCCADHGDVLNVYCITCQKLICATCKVFGDCQNCSVMRIEQAYEQQQQEITDCVRLTTCAVDGVQSAVNHCEDMRTRTRNIGDETLHTLNREFEKLLSAVEDKRAELLQRVQKVIDEKEGIIASHQKRYTDALNGANHDIDQALRLTSESDEVKFLNTAKGVIERMTRQQCDLQARPPPAQPPNPTKWRLDLHPIVDVVRKIDFGDNQSKMSGKLTKTASSANVIPRNSSQDSELDNPIMSASMVEGTPNSRRKFAPVNVPGFHRGSFAIPAASGMSTSMTVSGLDQSLSGGLVMESSSSTGRRRNRNSNIPEDEECSADGSQVSKPMSFTSMTRSCLVSSSRKPSTRSSISETENAEGHIILKDFYVKLTSGKSKSQRKKSASSSDQIPSLFPSRTGSRNDSSKDKSISETATDDVFANLKEDSGKRDLETQLTEDVDMTETSKDWLVTDDGLEPQASSKKFYEPLPDTPVSSFAISEPPLVESEAILDSNRHDVFYEAKSDITASTSFATVPSTSSESPTTLNSPVLSSSPGPGSPRKTRTSFKDEIESLQQAPRRCSVASDDTQKHNSKQSTRKSSTKTGLFASKMKRKMSSASKKSSSKQSVESDAKGQSRGKHQSGQSQANSQESGSKDSDTNSNQSNRTNASYLSIIQSFAKYL